MLTSVSQSGADWESVGMTTLRLTFRCWDAKHTASSKTNHENDLLLLFRQNVIPEPQVCCPHDISSYVTADVTHWDCSTAPSGDGGVTLDRGANDVIFLAPAENYRSYLDSLTWSLVVQQTRCNKWMYMQTKHRLSFIFWRLSGSEQQPCSSPGTAFVLPPPFKQTTWASPRSLQIPTRRTTDVSADFLKDTAGISKESKACFLPPHLRSE